MHSASHWKYSARKGSLSRKLNTNFRYLSQEVETKEPSVCELHEYDLLIDRESQQFLAARGHLVRIHILHQFREVPSLEAT